MTSITDTNGGLCGAPLNTQATPHTCACRQALLQTLKTRKPLKEHLVRCTRLPDGEKVEVVNTRLLYDSENRFMGIVIVIRDVTRLTKLEDALSERQRFGNIIGKSDAMQKVYSLLRQISDTDVNVLITGESGAGKELIAEALHFGSARRDGPLVKVNCAALSDNLLQSELMGHVRGAFTGAINNRKGRIQAAEGGTLFLDEIGDISHQMQRQLLRFLESKEYEKVGESLTRKADVRVVTATNCDLREKIRQGAFREDLYYRLIAIVFELPPLRERTEDIPLLCNHFIRNFKSDKPKHVSNLTGAVERKLMAYPWPGNVRELKNTVEYACTVCPGELIHEDDLPRYFISALADVPVPKGSKYKADASEKDAILKALDKVDWNKAKAARTLGMGRATLYNKLKRYGIENRKAD
ncbi:sigma 54-interacting transcriptional regulator [Desulfococcaceae bacterium HSG9]|nr:sigma 54-interacting transcriptional regulator [Desulfococcaceae bacterium HSG9]